jgi:cytochrome c biogenesis protein CcdA
LIVDAPNPTHLSQVIAQAVAPAFILGALAALIAVLVARQNRVVDRSQALNAISDDDPARAHLKGDLPRLKRRAMLLNNAILFASISAIFVTLLVIVAFVSAFFEIEHERGVAMFFIVTLGFFAAALVNLARETRIALHDYDCSEKLEVAPKSRRISSCVDYISRSVRFVSR